MTLCKRIDGKFLYPTDINILEDSSREIERLAQKVISKAGITRPRSCRGEACSCFVRYTKKKHKGRKLIRETKQLLKKLGIVCHCPPLGRPKKDSYPEEEKLRHKALGERNGVEATFGTGKQYKGQAEGNSPDMDCSLLLCQEFEEVLDGTSLSSFGKIPQIAANPQYDCYWCGYWGKPCAI